MVQIHNHLLCCIEWCTKGADCVTNLVYPQDADVLTMCLKPGALSIFTWLVCTVMQPRQLQDLLRIQESCGFFKYIHPVLDHDSCDRLYVIRDIVWKGMVY